MLPFLPTLLRCISPICRSLCRLCSRTFEKDCRFRHTKFRNRALSRLCRRFGFFVCRQDKILPTFRSSILPKNFRVPSFCRLQTSFAKRLLPFLQHSFLCDEFFRSRNRLSKALFDFRCRTLPLSISHLSRRNRPNVRFLCRLCSFLGCPAFRCSCSSMSKVRLSCLPSTLPPCL